MIDRALDVFQIECGEVFLVTNQLFRQKGTVPGDTVPRLTRILSIRVRVPADTRTRCWHGLLRTRLAQLREREGTYSHDYVPDRNIEDDTTATAKTTSVTAVTPAESG